MMANIARGRRISHLTYDPFDFHNLPDNLKTALREHFEKGKPLKEFEHLPIY